jgi:DNA-binding NarL/FixJ family response regulator/class 3 adenylate cyclase
MSDLPSGTVTFLFSDIEGSTRLLRRLAERFAEVLAVHDRVVRMACAHHGGREVNTQGDAFFVAFERARDAVMAAVEVQRALAAETWPEGTAVRVRMGLHTGEPALNENSYLGLGVHRASRICAVGHGGQVLLSSATREVLEDHLPAGISFIDLGSARLKDFDRPERLYQLVADGLDRDFGPVKARVAADGERRHHAADAATPDAIRIVLAEDNYLVREGVRRLLETQPGLEVVATCGDFDSLLAAVEAERPDVVLTDIRMPPGEGDEGVRAAEQLRTTHPETGVVILSQFSDPEYALALLEHGSERRAYLLKERINDLEQLVAAIRDVAAGGSAIDSKVVESLVAAGSRHDESPLDALTPREREVLSEMAMGKNNAGIAGSLVITEPSVEKYIHSIFQKLGFTWQPDVHRRVKAVLLFLAEQRR